MSDPRVKDLLEEGDKLFSKRQTLLSFWQELALNFYPERADFTVTRTMGNTFAENLMTSYPLVARRELGDAFSAMLRPTQKEWFKMGITREDRLDDDGRRWLANATEVQRRAMRPRHTQFVRATKESDHDFATFGQAVMSARLNANADDLLYQNWHLRDVVWCENAEGKIDTVHRTWKPYVKDIFKMFPSVKDRPVGSKLKEIADKDKYTEVECRHIVIPADYYEPPAGKKKPKTPYVSIYVDTADHEVLEETGSWNLIYIIPRWQTVSGSQYAYSPATVAALPDARLIQAMTLTLLEAGEKFTNPPLLAVQEAIRSDLQVFAGGVTWVDAEYDERLGEVLRPLTQDKSGMPLGRDLRNDVREMISECFYLNKLTGPNLGDKPEMTAFEVGQRVQAYIRQALPLFEPMEIDYNGALCEQTFDLLMRGGAFGSYTDIPPSVRGAEIQFNFDSPLTEAIEAQKGNTLAQSKQLLAQVADLDPTAAQMLDAKTALRDALVGIGAPPTWIRSQEEMAQIQADNQKKQQAAELLASMQQGANVAKTLADAGASAGQAADSPLPQMMGQAA